MPAEAQVLGAEVRGAAPLRERAQLDRVALGEFERSAVIGTAHAELKLTQGCANHLQALQRARLEPFARRVQTREVGSKVDEETAG